MKHKVIGSFILTAVLSVSVTGCSIKETETKVSNEPVVSQYNQVETSAEPEPQPTVISQEGSEIDRVHRERELFVVEEEPMTFSFGGELIKVEDKQGLANAIIGVEWINCDQIAVTCHVNPSLNYLTVYDVTNRKFTYEAYGYDFVWKDTDIKTVVYIEAPPHSSKKGGTYYIRDYEGNELYQSKKEIMTLGFDENGDITFELMDNRGCLENEKIKV